VSQGTPWRGDICNRAKDGSLYWVDSMIAPFIGNDGLVEKYVSIRTDITKRVEDQRRLEEMSTRMSLAIEGGNDGLWDWPDVHLKAQWWSPSYYAMLGYDDQELTPSSKSYRAILHPDSWAISRHANQQALAGLGSMDVEVQLRTKSAGYRWFRVRGKLGFDTQGRALRMAGSTQDITERKNYERELQAARRDAEAATISKGQFLANMSHEIRTPMNAILGLLNLLQNTELTARQIDYASKTEGAAKSLLGLLNDILDFSKVEAGKMALESEPFRIDRVLRDLSVVLSANVGAKDVEVLFDLDTSLPAVVRGDALRLQQVLVNLAGNAIKFTARGQVVLALRTLAHTNDAVTIEFSVQDTGIGIAQEHQALIFSGFSQAEGSTTRRFGGTGLGLAISKRLVEVMGGEIQITSSPGAGSTFSFALQMPVVALVPYELAMAQRPALAPQRVLVVEDNPVAGELMLRMVRSWGWTADLAESGTRALELVSMTCADEPMRMPYSLIYMDWQLPDRDGWESTRHIRQWVQRKGLAQPVVIMVTAHGRETLAQRTLDEQDMLNGFLVKPVTASMLYDAVMDAGSANSGLRLAAKGRSNARQLSGMRILVVEDNLINQQVADELLSASGAIVSLAANGQIGVDAVAAAAPQFDVVLMDVQMPVLDGYGATAAIRGKLGLAQLPIIAMTANAMASDRDACMAAGMNAHIGKPFDMAELVSLLVRMTGFQPQTEQAFDAPDGLALPLPEVPGLDLHTALGRMSGLRGLYVRTARDFVKFMDTIVPELQQCLASGDKRMAMMRLHTLKGNAGTLGAVELAARAAKLEALCKAGGGMQECEQGLADFAFLVQSTQCCLKDAIASLDQTPTRTAAPAADPVAHCAASAALRKIAALAAADNLDVLQCFAEARDALCGLPADRLDRLDEALQNLDLQAAHALCQEMSQLPPMC
jgi:PAS domain S-box-containing protein